jgi:hypothetical protein
MKNINGSNQIIQNIRSIKKGRPLGMNQFKWFNLNGQIQNKIKFSYLGSVGVSII